MTARYAIYAAPAPESPLWSFGSAVIGYDAATGEDLPFAPDLALPPDWPNLTEDPRRYGFHATLKAPFHLAESRSEAELLEAAAIFARHRPVVDVPLLAVQLIDGFVALVPADPAPPLAILAADCVRAFDPYRAQMSDADQARRRAANLSERQIAQIEHWGYPYIFEDFRFHMTLTGRLPNERRAEVRAMLADTYARLPPGFTADAIAVFRQESREDRFRLIERLPFGG
jgi:putative phosphonate metabolism protein